MVHKGGAKPYIQREGREFIAHPGVTGGEARAPPPSPPPPPPPRSARLCPFVHLRIGRRFMGISSALWAAGGRAVCAPVHETRPQAWPPPRASCAYGGRGLRGLRRDSRRGWREIKRGAERKGDRQTDREGELDGKRKNERGREQTRDTQRLRYGGNNRELTPVGG
jgi:hypothetical protein